MGVLHCQLFGYCMRECAFVPYHHIPGFDNYRYIYIHIYTWYCRTSVAPSIKFLWFSAFRNDTSGHMFYSKGQRNKYFALLTPLNIPHNFNSYNFYELLLFDLDLARTQPFLTFVITYTLSKHHTTTRTVTWALWKILPLFLQNHLMIAQKIVHTNIFHSAIFASQWNQIKTKQRN